MIVYSSLPEDVRVRREASALVQNGYMVDIVCLKNSNQQKFEIIDGINVFRLNLEKSRYSKKRYILLYLLFFVKAFLKVNSLWLKKRYKIIHVHNMPDFLVFIPILQKLFGAKLILDLHDPTPEVFMTKFSSSGFQIWFLKLQEKLSIKFADRIITTNIAFVNTFVKRGCPRDKITIVMNSPDERIFVPFDARKTRSRSEDKFIIMYHGGILERHGLDIAVKAIDLLKNRIPGVEFWVFGDGEFKGSFLSLVSKLSLGQHIKYYGPVPLEKIAESIPKISLGIIPNRLSPFTSINFPTRIFEYLHYKKPVIVPKTEGIQDYFDDDSIIFFQPNNISDLSESVLRSYYDKSYSQKIITKGFAIYYDHRWELETGNLLNIYNNLLYFNFIENKKG